MGRIGLAHGIYAEETINLDAVTTATTGSTIDCRWYNKISVFMISSANTGAVTVTIEASIDGTNFFELQTKTYTSTNSNDVYHYNSYYPYIRTKTSTHSNATLSTYIAARS